MTAHTHETALVFIPPDSCWEPIQAIRREHDRQIRRWMPHITLIYPFRPRAEFDALAGPLRQACAMIEPFELRLAEFRDFPHGRDHYTLWLAPEPPAVLVRLQAVLQAVAPDCDETSRHAAGFTPHLSVGQVRGPEALARLKCELQQSWTPLSFTACDVRLIYRHAPPDDIFRVGRTIPLGR